MKHLLENLKSTGLKFNLLDSNILDRIVSDYILSTKLKVLGVLTPNPDHKVKSKCKYYDQLPVKLLPNCASYKVESSKLSWLNGLFNLISRTGKSSGVIIGWTNTHRNRYLLYRFNQLGHLRDAGKNVEYWRQAMKLLKSPAYQVSSFNYTVSDWHTTLSGSEVERVFTQLNSLISIPGKPINYRRVYIPKPNRKVRPLGVPTLSWRVYLHMLNNLIVWWKLGSEPNQHGYLPKRGVLTCWSEVMKRLESSQSVYEFDLKGFFDNVDLKQLECELRLIGVPFAITQTLGMLNRSVVKLTSRDELDESAHRKILFNSDHSLNPNLPPHIQTRLKSCTSPKDLSSMLESLISEGYSFYRTNGVPQGAATSCGLSTLNLRKLYTENQVIMYADDGIVFDATEEPSCTYPEAGITKEATKSRWIKRAGHFQTSLKFLGLEYIPSNIKGRNENFVTPHPRLRSNTRNGALLEFDENLQFLCYLSLEYKKLYSKVEKEIKRTMLENIDIEEINAYIAVAMSEYSLSKLLSPNLSIVCWIESCHIKFKKLSPHERLNLLFTTPAGPVTLSRMYNGSLDLLNVSDTSLVFSHRSWVSVKWGSYLYRMSQTTYYRELVAHLVEHNLLHLPKRFEDLLKNFPTDDLLQLVYGTLFKLKDISSKWVIADQVKSEFLRYRKFLKWYLRTNRLSLRNASTFACDDLLTYLRANGSITGWKYNHQIGRCKAGTQKYLDPKTHKERFEAGKSELLKLQRTKLKQEQKSLHKEYYYSRNHPLPWTIV